MMDPTNLRQALLDLGLEDDIPLPEAATDPEVLSEGASVEDISTALIELLREGRIQISAGHWSQEPEFVDPGTAEELLRDHEQYTFKSTADLRLRVYYVNVDNVRS
ncbi:hypothetical protein [Arthrobacter rhizosphaerae]|uniref:hypothetical protein n=1 Tax=Arthrobacter rhizosphaerae TaxID=2855490 RepID=UPI001FF5664A|nr:hypothetical protein [Arthrobacter rhizosphaerae]